MLKEGSILRGNFARYKISTALGEGARGQTYLALVDELADNLPGGDAAPPLQVAMPVVIKIPPALGAEYRNRDQQRFLKEVNEGLQQEYRLFSRLRGTSSAAHVYDSGTFEVAIGSTPELCFFLASEYIQGPRLDQWREAPARRESFGAEEFFHWARKLTEALSEIHCAGVVHGDVWPRNIIIRGDAEPVFIDFGESIIRDISPPHSGAGRSHPYLAPEKELSVKADIFSLCATLFYLATGSEPPKLSREPGGVSRKVAEELNALNPDLYAECSGIANIIGRGLRTEDRRTPDAERVLADIDLFDPKTSTATKDLRSLLNLVGGRIATLEAEEPIFARMVGVKLRQLDLYIDEMLRGGIHDVRGDHEVLVMTMTQYLSVCEAGDVYLTASVPYLWRIDNMGVSGRFLAMNKAIIKRGTTVRRVFVVTKEEMEKPDTREVLQAHAEVLAEIDHETKGAVNTTRKDLAAGGAFTGVVVLTEEKERKKRFEQSPHSGVWIRDSKAKVVLPFYNEATWEMTGVRLLPGDGRPPALIRDFEREYLDDAVEIRAFLDPDRGDGSQIAMEAWV